MMRTVTLITCDHPGCSAEVRGRGEWDAWVTACELGWQACRPGLDGDPRTDLCPAHREAGEPR